MFVDDFKTRYTTIPFATHSRNRLKNTRAVDTRTLLHLHKEIEIFLVLSGAAEAEVDGKIYQLKQGDIAMVAPYTLHRYTLFADRDIHHYCLCFDADLLFDKALKEALESGKIPLNCYIQNSARCATFIQNAYLAHAEQKEGWEFKVVGNLSLLFGALKEEGYIGKPRDAAHGSVYSRIFHYISEHLADPISSRDAAKQMNLDHSYFCRLFKKCFGENFQNYLCKFRVEKSKQLLRCTDAPISQIAYEVGFNGLSYYSQKFKEYSGVTPKEYRRRHS